MKKRKNGFVTLMSVIVIGAVGTSVALTLLLLGTDSLRSTQTLFESAKAKAYADTCAEEALLSLRQDINYAGGATINFPDGSCDILPIDNNGTQTPLVKIEGTVGLTKRRVEILARQVNPQLTINYWREVAGF